MKIIRYLINCYLQKFIYNNKVEIRKNAVVDMHSQFEGSNLVSHRTYLKEVSLGFASYVGNDSRLIKTKIGKYSCIGPFVSIIIGQHPTKGFVSVHPVFYSTKKQVGFTFVDHDRFEEIKHADNNGHYVIIGNDVWIGAGARIMGGVTIGDGAIIGAGALVTKDVLPYSIVVGIPAKIIRYRFSQERINKLEEIAWWNKPKEWIMNHSSLFLDIDQFLAVVEGEL
jgi:acetyltransferase-like isoleucine patch superfamily enzyme